MTPAVHDACCDALMRALEALGREDVVAVRIQLRKALFAVEPGPAPVATDVPKHFSDTEKEGE